MDEEVVKNGVRIFNSDSGHGEAVAGADFIFGAGVEERFKKNRSKTDIGFATQFRSQFVRFAGEHWAGVDFDGFDHIVIRVRDGDKIIKEYLEYISVNWMRYKNLFDKRGLPEEVGEKNCENWTGSVVIPVGLAGPLVYYLKDKRYEIQVPLATYEGALVASVNRGMKLLRLAGGARVMVEDQGMTRAPVFECEDGRAAQRLKEYLVRKEKVIARVGEATSGHLKYRGQRMWIRGRHLFVRWMFDTDLAMGMNMVTIASQAMAERIVKIRGVVLRSLSSNVCCDKKDNLINELLGRGYWAQAEVEVEQGLLKRILKVEAGELVKTHIQKNLVGSNLAGSGSQNAQVANVVTALFLATGQDVAQVVEGSRGYLSLEERGKKVYAAVTLPNLDLGVVGGGTYLPAQAEARQLMGIKRADNLAAVMAAAALAGELSLLASLTEGSLAKAHKRLTGREK